jgi:signal peptidase II
VCAAQDVDVLSGRRGLRGLPLALTVAAVTVAADRLTKVWAEARLVAGPCRPGGDECIELIGSLRLHLVYNTGAAFSTGTRLGPLFGAAAVVMTVVLLRLAAAAQDRTRSLFFGLIAGGAVGNLIDRVVRAEDGLLSGGVVDFVDLQWWPVFNLADAAVVTGVIAFVLRSLHGERASEPDG